MHKKCFQFLPGITVVPPKIKQCLCKILAQIYYGQCVLTNPRQCVWYSRLSSVDEQS